MRICSFLPGATEILFMLGLGDSVAGVTHECDSPPEVRTKRILVRPRIQAKTSAEIDRDVSEQVAQGASLYAVDAEALREIGPDIIITQDLCTVCAASPNDLSAVLASLPKPPRVIMFSPRNLAGVWQGILEVGLACGREDAARLWVESAQKRLRRVTSELGDPSRPRVACLEWIDPFYVAGHWTPEMIRLAGGRDVLARAGEHSVRVTWEQVVAAKPEVLLIAPCGFTVAGAMEELRRTSLPKQWAELPAVRDRRVYAIDANSYTSRSGPRLVDGIEMLAHILHPVKWPNMHPSGWCAVTASTAKSDVATM